MAKIIVNIRVENIHNPNAFVRYPRRKYTQS
jgi:hypothetical protein